MQNQKVLLVEDNNDIRELYAYVLARAGFDVLEAPDGEVALKILDENEPDMLITDIQTPHLDGISLIHYLRQEERWEDLPIVAISSYGEEQLAEATIQGATRTLRKPLEPNRLLATLFSLTKRSGKGIKQTQ